MQKKKQKKTERNYVFWRSAFENQICIAQIVSKSVISIWNIFQQGGGMVVFNARFFMVVFQDFKEL